jgi:hypothetical protein
LGEVTHAGMAGDQPVIRAVGNFLGIEPVAVIIPAALLVQKADRIEVSMSAAEVKDRLAEQQQQRKQEE